MSSVFDTILNSHFFLHLRHSQCTQFHFRFSGLKILSWDSRTQKYEFRFPNLKIWEKFTGLKFWGSDLQKIQEKNQKFQSSKNVQKRCQVSKRVLGRFFWKSFFAQCSMESSKVCEKIKKNSKLQKSPKSFPKLSKFVLNMFGAIFSNFFFAQGSLRGISDSLDLEIWVPILEIKKHEFSFPDL